MPTTAKKGNRGLHFKLLFVGLFLLGNPTWSLLDIFPNALATLLVLLALRHVPSTLLYFREVKDALTRLFWISLSKLLAGFFALTIMGGNTGERGIFAVFGFVYFVLELLFLLPAFRDLFHATSYLDERYGVASCGGIAGEKRFYSVDTLLSLTYAFFVVRGVVSFLPECLFLSTYDELTGEGAFAYMVQRLYGPLVIVCQAVGYVFMAVWFTQIYRYFNGIRQDKDFWLLLAAEDEKIGSEERKKAYSARLFSLAFLCLAVGVGLNIDLVFDDIGVFPDFLSALLFIAFGIMLYGFLGKRQTVLTAVTGSVYFATSLVAYILETVFARCYDLSDLHRVIAADNLYFACRVFAVLNAVAFTAMLLSVTYSLYRMVRLRLGSDKADLATYSGRRLADSRRFYKSRLAIFAVIGFLDAVCTALNVFLRALTVKVPASEEHLQTSTLVIPEFGWFWLVTLSLSLLWLGYTIYLNSRIEEEWQSVFED